MLSKADKFNCALKLLQLRSRLRLLSKDTNKWMNPSEYIGLTKTNSCVSRKPILIMSISKALYSCTLVCLNEHWITSNISSQFNYIILLFHSQLRPINQA